MTRFLFWIVLLSAPTLFLISTRDEWLKPFVAIVKKKFRSARDEIVFDAIVIGMLILCLLEITPEKLLKEEKGE